MKNNAKVAPVCCGACCSRLDSPVNKHCGACVARSQQVPRQVRSAEQVLNRKVRALGAGR